MADVIDIFTRERIVSLDTHKKIEEAWNSAVENNEKEIAYFLEALLRQIGYDYGHRE